MKTGAVISVFVVVLLVLGGLFGVGVLWDQYFGGAESRKTNDAQNIRLDKNDVTDQRQDNTLDAHGVRHNESDRLHRQHTTNIQNNESKINANRAAIEELKVVDQATTDRMNAQDKVIEGMQAEDKAQKASLEELQRALAATKAEMNRVKEEHETTMKHQEERIRRMERILGVGDPQQ